MKSSASLGAIAPALVAALAEIGGVAKGKTNPAFKSKYATLENVIEASKGILASHGIALLQFPAAFSGGAMSLDTVLLHESGEWLSGEEAFGVATSKSDPQAVGSALTYARRYAQMAVLNMPAVDDDGEAAMQRTPAPKAVSDEPPSAVVQTATASLTMCRDEADLKEWMASNGEMIAGLSEVEKQGVRKAYAARQNAIKSATNPFDQQKAA